jgi:hypothetical protein
MEGHQKVRNLLENLRSPSCRKARSRGRFMMDDEIWPQICGWTSFAWLAPFTLIDMLLLPIRSTMIARSYPR